MSWPPLPGQVVLKLRFAYLDALRPDWAGAGGLAGISLTVKWSCLARTTARYVEASERDAVPLHDSFGKKNTMSLLLLLFF